MLLLLLRHNNRDGTPRRWANDKKLVPPPPPPPSALVVAAAVDAVGPPANRVRPYRRRCSPVVINGCQTGVTAASPTRRTLPICFCLSFFISRTFFPPLKRRPEYTAKSEEWDFAVHRKIVRTTRYFSPPRPTHDPYSDGGPYIYNTCTMIFLLFAPRSDNVRSRARFRECAQYVNIAFVSIFPFSFV